MDKIIEGVVHGRTIELLGDPGVAEGQKVQVVLVAPYAEVPGARGFAALPGPWLTTCIGTRSWPKWSGP